MDKKLRELIYERSGGYCELCCYPLADSWAIHHRKLRSQGGQDEAVNLVALHHWCHNLGTKSVHLNPKESTERGYIVPSWGNPKEIPICPDDQIKLMLFENGTKQTVEE